MSHRDDCPSRYEARRRGERDYEDRGYRSYRTPYDSHFGEEGCPEAKRAYEEGQRHAEYRAEQESEERRREECRQVQLRQQRYEQERWDEEMEARRAEADAYDALLYEVALAEMEVADLHAQF